MSAQCAGTVILSRAYLRIDTTLGVERLMRAAREILGVHKPARVTDHPPATARTSALDRFDRRRARGTHRCCLARADHDNGWTEHHHSTEYDHDVDRGVA